MRNYRAAILLILLLLISTVFTGCGSQALETGTASQDTLEQTAVITSQMEKSTTETEQAKTPVVMSITPEEAYRIISEGIDHFLLDVRTEEEYNQGHIEGANLIPVQELENRLDEIPRDRQIIVYCRSGNRSRTAANILLENGFGMVYDMGGINDWQSKGFPVVVGEEETVSQFEEITVDEAYQIFMSDKDYLFVDVRTVDEYSSAHIEGAVNIPVTEIEGRLSEIPKEKIIIVYCNGSSCNRSKTAAGILIENGYTQVYNLAGNGILEWVEKGYPKIEDIS